LPPNSAHAPDASVSAGNGPSLPVLPLCPAAPPKPGESLPAELPELDLERPSTRGPEPWWRLRRSTVSCLVSAAVHAALMVILAILVDARTPGSSMGSLTAYFDRPEALETLWEESPYDAIEVSPEPIEGGFEGEGVEAEAAEVSLPQERPDEQSRVTPESVGFEALAATDWLQSAEARVGGGLEGRHPEARAQMLARRGGTPDSEGAVERGLRWLAAHQASDGSWHFNLQHCNCQGYCRNPGTVATTTGATALSLLAFLGANHTHLAGEHRDVVRKGLYYLGSRAMISAEGADLRDGTMYAQGLAAIALCEAYAMTEDPGLKDLAQQSLNYIVFAQDTRGGGWRYSPGEPGDTTVTGWQVMALKSGQLARLQVPRSPMYLAERFLDGVQSDDGAQYGYMNPEPRPTTTAIGLLCRMYLGWSRSRPALARGVSHISRWGPSDNDIYFNYYATQVLFHWGGSEWDRWNRPMRDYLVRTQASQGHESGSWHFEGTRAGDKAGRLFSTAMAVMTLEVYYRYMPLYGEKSVE